MPELLTPAVLSRLESMELRARLIVEGFITGLHKSPYHGFSVEFAEHRAYNAGDDPRHVDWKVFGRKERLYVKQYEEETNLRHHVVLDTSASMRYRGAADVTKLHYGATLAAALHTLMVRQRDATGLVAFDGAVHTLIPPRATGGHLRGLLATLDRLAGPPEGGAPGTAPASPPGQTALAAALHEVAERIPRRALVVVVTDLFETAAGPTAEAIEPVARALRHLRYRGHEVIVFHLLDGATERAFDFPNAPAVFRDMETGEEVTLQPAQLRAHYAEAVAAFAEAFRRRCREMQIDLVEADTAQPYDAALLAYLNKRRRLY